jgi:hypothetical protein
MVTTPQPLGEAQSTVPTNKQAVSYSSKPLEVEFITKKAAVELNIDVERPPFVLGVLHIAG